MKMIDRRWTILVGSLIAMIMSPGPILQVSISLFLKPVTAELGWSRAAFSSGVMAASIATMIVLPFTGRILDKFGTKRGASPFVIFFAVGFAALSTLSGGLTFYYAAFALIGMSVAAQATPTYARIISLWFDKRRGIAMGVAMTGFALGHVLMPIYGQWAIDTYGWRMAYVLLGLINLVVVLPIFWFVLSEPPEAQAATSAHTAEQEAVATAVPGVTLREAAHGARFWTFLGISFLLGGSFYAIIAHCIAMLTDQGWTTSKAVALLSASGVANLLGRLSSGWLLDRTSSPALPALLLLLPGASAFMLFTGNSDLWPYIAIPLFFFAHGADGDVLPYFAGRYFGLRHFGQIYGVLFSAFVLGSGLGPFLAGRAHDVFHTYSPGLVVVTLSFVTAYVLALTMGKYIYTAGAHGK